MPALLPNCILQSRGSFSSLGKENCENTPWAVLHFTTFSGKHDQKPIWNLKTFIKNFVNPGDVSTLQDVFNS